MINIKHLHALFKQRMNRGSTNFLQDFTSLEIDQFINDAVRIVLERIFEDEGQQQKIDYSSSLLITYPDQPVLVPTNIDSGKYEVPLSSLKYPYLHYKRLIVNQGCGDVKVTIETSGRLNDILADDLQKPSKQWRRVFAYLGKTTTSQGKSIFILCEPGTTISSFKIEYLRYPKPVFFGGYDSVSYLDCRQRNGSNCNQFYSKSSPIQDLELDSETFQSLIVDYAVAEAFRVIQSGDGVNLASEKITRIMSE